MVDQSHPMEVIERELKRVIPPGVEVRRSDTRSGQIEKMVSAFHLNLTALSFISLIVGMFLIYNAISISVIQRRREIGILRSIGLTRSQTLRLFIRRQGGSDVWEVLSGLEWESPSQKSCSISSPERSPPSISW